MTDVGTFVAFSAGALLGATIMAIWMGTIAHSNFEKYRAMVAVAFELEQTIIHLEHEVYPEHWILQAEGAADPVVVRGRPDLQRSIAIADHEAEWVEEPLKSEPRGSHVIKIESELEEDNDA